MSDTKTPSAQSDPIAVAIMAGGKSRRMGRDKAELKIDGKTLLERMVDTALQVSDTVAVVGRVGARRDVIWMEDDAPGMGPLGGLKTALTRLNRPILVLGCDMPRVDAEALGWLVESLRNSRAPHGLATRRGGRVEPLFSAYCPAALPLINARIEAGYLSLTRLIEGGAFDFRDAPEALAAKLVNINTPEDLAELFASR